MQSGPFLACAGLLIATLGCRKAPDSRPAGLSVATPAPPSSVLRLPGQGGLAQVYRLPTLAAASWRSDVKFPPVARSIGADLDQRLVYALSQKGDIVVLDLQRGGVRPYLARVRDAAMGPDGTLFSVDDSNLVTQTVRRTPTPFRTRLSGRPRGLYGMRDQELMAVTSTARTSVTLLGTDRPEPPRTLPAGLTAATYWGDLLAVAADSAVVLYDPRGAGTVRSLRISGHARSVVFSPSGHRIYVADDEGRLQVINRYTEEVVDRIRLPGRAGDLRPDPFGRWLLVRDPAADSIWVVDLANDKYVGAIQAEWREDLPTITNLQILLIKRGTNVLALDLTRAGWPAVGTVPGGAKDLWLPLAWTPETGTANPEVAETTAVAPGDTAGAAKAAPEGVYLQVSSSQNPEWAGELARQLKDAGLPASVLRPKSPDDGYRVVLGPYASREEAEATGKKLGRPFFIYQPDQSPPR